MSSRRSRVLRADPSSSWIEVASSGWRPRVPMIDLVTGRLRAPKSTDRISEDESSSLHEQIAELGQCPGRRYLPMDDSSGLSDGACPSNDLSGDEAARLLATPMASAGRLPLDLVCLSDWLVQLPICIGDAPDTTSLVHSIGRGLKARQEPVAVALDSTTVLNCEAADRQRALSVFEATVTACAEHAIPCSLLLPLIGGLIKLTEPSADLSAWLALAADLAVAAVVPVLVAFDPADARRLADWRRSQACALSQRSELDLFQARPPVLREVAREIAARQQCWWLEPPAHFASDATSSVNRGNAAISAQLMLIAEMAVLLGRSVGLVEGYRQAARRLVDMSQPAERLYREGNLHLLDWMDARVSATLIEWFASAEPGQHSDPGGGEPPALGRLRAEFMADCRQCTGFVSGITQALK